MEDKEEEKNEEEDEEEEEEEENADQKDMRLFTKYHTICTVTPGGNQGSWFQIQVPLEHIQRL